MQTELKIEQVPIVQLRAAEYNPRKWTEQARKGLTDSLDEFGFVQPIVVNAASDRRGVIIGGNFKLDIAKSKGIESVPVVWVDLTLEKEKALNLRLNRNGGEFDLSLLADFDQQLLADIGFSSKELDKIFNEDGDDEFDAETEVAAIITPASKLGDIFQLGRHRLLCGDATKGEDIKKLMGGGIASMVFTDPPYNVDYTGKTKDALKIQNDKMTDQDFTAFLSTVIKNLFQVCERSFYICMSSQEFGSLKDIFVNSGGHWGSTIIWVKHTFALSHKDWHPRYEPILYGWKQGSTHYYSGERNESDVWEPLEKIKAEFDGQKTHIQIGGVHLELDGEVKGRATNKEAAQDIWYEKKPSRSREHPTMKPVKLVEKAIRASSIRDGIVLDIFGGSGTTLIAAEGLNRVCYMMEFDPRFVDVIIKRWEILTGGKAQKI